MELDIAKMLAMSEAEQIDELFLHDYDPEDESLADLALRLRDEAVMLKSFQWACAEVYNAAHHFTLEEAEMHAPTMMVWVWFATHAQPIHWILAALKAKEK